MEAQRYPEDYDGIVAGAFAGIDWAEKIYGQRLLAKTAGFSREALRAILKGEAQPRPKTMAKLLRAISVLTAKAGETSDLSTAR
jgi:hypothetical protein